jgi:hypothetical protein
MHQHFRQGDVMIRAISGIPSGAARTHPTGRIILAAGEVTGHHHAITLDPGIRIDSYEKDGKIYLHIEGGDAVLSHEEHGCITLPPGDYQSWIQKEYSPEAIRNVAD